MVAGDDEAVLHRLKDELKDFDWDSANKLPTFIDKGEFDPSQRLWVQKKSMWMADSDGKVRREDNEFMNGSIDLTNPDEIRVVSLAHSTLKEAVTDPINPKNKGHGWAPVFSATAFLNDNARIYGRYSQALRMPSMFESTMGFSASNFNSIKPERAQNVEFAYVHDLRDVLGAQRYADVKLAYYRNNIKNVIERDKNFYLMNMEKQIISGLELQGRYDNGRFFADLGVNYTLTNKVCDEQTALITDPYLGRVKNCVDDGFRNGYLRNMAQPRQSVNLLLGRRFLNQRLELGGRLLYHKGSINKESSNFYDIGRYTSYFNVPLYWTSVVVVDAHVNYKLNRQLSLEVAGSNLTNRYYLDPLSRTRMPAPGRTLKLSLIGKF